MASLDDYVLRRVVADAEAIAALIPDMAKQAASIDRLRSVLASVGQDTETCGDLCLEAEAPDVRRLARAAAA